MRPTRIAAAALLALGVVYPRTARAQAQANPPLEIGAMAPDFSLRGATRYGALRDPVRLAEFRGKTMVIAFFFRARTRG
jgi:hypothetical protein